MSDLENEIVETQTPPDSVVFLNSKEEALANGVPEADFDPEIHLFKQTAVLNLPQTVTANATLPDESHDG